jgi:hypothetical protein
MDISMIIVYMEDLMRTRVRILLFQLSFRNKRMIIYRVRPCQIILFHLY